MKDKVKQFISGIVIVAFILQNLALGPPQPEETVHSQWSMVYEE